MFPIKILILNSITIQITSCVAGAILHTASFLYSSTGNNHPFEEVIQWSLGTTMAGDVLIERGHKTVGNNKSSH